MSGLQSIIAKLADGAMLTADEAQTAFDTIMDGEATDGQIGAFLMGLRQRGETVDEITAGARAMRARAVKVSAPQGAIDTCGTGGDGSGTYNISTAVALVLAGIGVPVAKHGNRALSSKSGSMQVLEALGVKIDIPPTRVEACIRDANIGFMFAVAHHGAMKHVGPVRQQLGFRTIFNLLGPMSNPAGAKHQLIGVFAREWITPMAHTLNALGTSTAWVVHGSDGLDELTTTGESYVAALKDNAVSSFTISPADAGLPIADPAALIGGDPAQNAAAMRDVLAGAKNAYRDIVVLNAAAALIVAGKADNLKTGASLATSALDDGKAQSALEALVAISNAPDEKAI